MQGQNQVSGYFDIERPRFALEHGPDWLKLDQATGVLSGTPDEPGRVDVTVTAAIDREVRQLDQKALVWGNEKSSRRRPSMWVPRPSDSSSRFVVSPITEFKVNHLP